MGSVSVYHCGTVLNQPSDKIGAPSPDWVMLDSYDLTRLLHPMLAASFVMPLIGMVTYFALQTRRRNQANAAQEKTKIPPSVGLEHVKLGRWLTGAVVGLVLLGLLHPIVKTLVANKVLETQPFQVVFIVLLFGLTVGSCFFLYRSKSATWRGIFATLTGMGLILLGCQDGVYRRTHEWYLSHYYFGMTAALLMIFSLAILPDIYRNQRLRQIHIISNSIAVLLFISQGITGTRDLLEIPLHWQEPYLYRCDYVNKSCAE